MHRQLKAEWFRLTHSGHYFSIFIAFALLASLIPFLVSEVGPDADLYATVAGNADILSAMFPILIGTLTAMTVSMAFHHRTYYYEIMDGASIHRIIGARLLIYNLLIIVVAGIPMGVMYTVIGIQRGIGAFESPALFTFLCFIVTVHTFTTVILVSMLFKHLVAAVIFPYLICAIEVISHMLVMEMASSGKDTLQRVFDCFPSIQYTRLAQPSYDALFIVTVIGSFLIETMLLYIGVFLTYKHKKFS